MGFDSAKFAETKSSLDTTKIIVVLKTALVDIMLSH